MLVSISFDNTVGDIPYLIQILLTHTSLSPSRADKKRHH